MKSTNLASNKPDTDVETSAVIAADVKLLAHFGYKQELRRKMNRFSNFAISFSIICILAGGITSLQQGTSGIGGASVVIVWILGSFISLFVAMTMAQVASAFPTAGGLYHWSSILGGRGWGWATGWFNLIGLYFMTAAVNVGTYTLFINIVLPLIGIDPTKLTLVHQAMGMVIITGSHALFNHRGIRVTKVLTDFSGYLIFVVAVTLTLAMYFYAPSHDFGRFFHIENFSGAAGGDVWPANGSIFCLILMGLLWPMYTIIGFDASAHTSEETIGAAQHVPRGIIDSVYLSGIFGFAMVAAFVLAFPSVQDGAKQGANVFFWLMDSVIPRKLKIALEISIVVSNYLCGLACLTSTSRMTFAFARDGGLPKLLKRVSPKFGVPSAAIWIGAAMIIGSTIYTPVYTTLTAASVILLYISYVMPTTVGIFVYGTERWKEMGPFNLGRTMYRTLGVFAILGVIAVTYGGIQPPNRPTLPVLIGLSAFLRFSWYCLGERKRFAGPPVNSAVHRPSYGQNTHAASRE
ncbi:MAG: amino acid permease [Pedosphaera sp.]|nr:amino acid permease [Pedosphaera sp.]